MTASGPDCVVASGVRGSTSPPPQLPLTRGAVETPSEANADGIPPPHPTGPHRVPPTGRRRSSQAHECGAQDARRGRRGINHTNPHPNQTR